jgi:beta-carotene ketolase (CrtO type)
MPINNNKHLIKFLVLSVPYQLEDINNQESRKYMWVDVKDRYADQIIDIITRDYIPNLKDVILKRVTYSPSDYEKNLLTLLRELFHAELCCHTNLHGCAQSHS